MPILQFTTDVPGQINVNPRKVSIVSSDNFATVTTAGYLNAQLNDQGYPIYPTDFIFMCYNFGVLTPPSFSIFTPSITNGVITLIDTAGSGTVTLPTIANHIATYTNVSGGLGEDAATAINGGNVQAGLSGTAGTVASFPATSAKGSLALAAVANTGNTVTTISNAAMGQASVVSIPDPGAATAGFVVAPAALVNNNLVKASGTAGLVADAGARIIANTTAAFGGGGTTNTYTATGLTSTCVGTAVILASTNSVSITKAVPGTNTLAITFSADPGAATTVNYLYVTAVQS
jgi:hypothetical protein